MMEEIDRFNAVSDDGNRYTVRIMRHFNTFTPLNGAPKRTPGPIELFTTKGDDVNQIDDETYQIVLTDEIIRKI